MVSRGGIVASFLCLMTVMILVRNNGWNKYGLYTVHSAPSDSVCDIYDHHTPVHDNYPCVMMNMIPSTWICLYPEENDTVVSKAFWNGKVFESGQVELMKARLESDNEMGLIDIGANIGIFSLVAAAMGHPVVAVEPNLESAQRLHKGIKMGGLEDKITLVGNAVSRERGITEMETDMTNRGHSVIGQQNTTGDQTVATILMDDLLPLINFKKAVLKIDVEGFEHFAFAKAERLFNTIDIQYIMMEWEFVKKHGLSKANEADRTLFNHMMEIFHAQGYAVYGCGKNAVNSLGEKWQSWPWNICLIKQVQ